MADEETLYESTWDQDEGTSHSREFPTANWGGDTHTVVTEKGWISRLMDSVAGALLGILMFLGSFGLLYWNEGRLDLSTIAQKAVEMKAAAPNMAAQGKLIAATGTLTAGPKLGDQFLAPGSYVALRREVEMYAWSEDEHTKTEKSAGGSERKITTYSYSRGWTRDPENSSSFKRKGYRNPTMAVEGADLKAQAARVGVIPVNLAKVGLPSYKKIPLTSANTRGGRLAGGRLYLRGADPGYPEVGDLRVSYSAVPTGGTATLMGQMGPGKQVQPYLHSSGDAIYRVFDGTKKDAVKTLHGEHVMMTWILRAVGFLLMWFGMRAVIEPLNTVLDVLPFLGDLGRGLTGFATFLVAAVLTIVTIIVAQILHNLLAMLAVAAVIIVGAVLIFGKKNSMTRKVRRA